MTYGVEIYSNTNKLIYSTEMTTYNFIGSYIIPAHGGQSIPISVLSFEFVEITWYVSFIGSPPSEGEAIIPTISASKTSLLVGSDGTVPVLIVVLAR